MHNSFGPLGRVPAPSDRCSLYSAFAALSSILGGWHFLIPEGALWARLSLTLPLSALLLYSFFRAVFRLGNPHLSLRQETAAAFLFVFFQSLGFYFDEGRYLANLGLLPAGLLFVRAALLTPLAAGVLRLLCAGLSRLPEGHANAPLRFRTWAAGFALILVFWGIVWLAYWPGFFNYDAWQVDEVLHHSYSKHHPLLHTLLLGHCYRFGLSRGDANLGVALYCGFQMAVMAAILSLAFAYLHARGHRILAFLALLFYAAFPANPILALSTTKDVLFSGLILLALVTALLALHARTGKARMLLLLCEIPVLTLILLLRNNAQYAVLLTLTLCVLFIRHRRWRAVLLVFAASFVLFKASDTALTRALSAEPGEIAEALSVPIQQCGRIYTRLSDEGADDKTQAAISAFFDMDKAYYRPERSDLMKFYAKIDRGNAMAFLKLSCSLLLRYPLESLDAFLCLTKGAWDIGDMSYAEAYRGVSDRAGVLFTDIKPGYGITLESRLPALEHAMEQLVSGNTYFRLPLLPLLFSPAVYVWLFALFALLTLSAPGRAAAPLLPFFAFLLLTILAGPCILVRYIYPFMLCAPVVLSLLPRGRKR
ncbi:MAG: hypothetical protein IJ175_10335 [Clostridia bacterium]|nr:hypothetical protein [Clostridia bacterium]